MVTWLVWLRCPVRRRALGVRNFLGRILCHVGWDVVPFEIVRVEGCCRAGVSGRPRLHGFWVREFLPAVNKEQQRKHISRVELKDCRRRACLLLWHTQDKCTGQCSFANSMRPGSGRTG